jgi:hypothetical protein
MCVVLGELLQILKLLRLHVFQGGSLQIRDTDCPLVTSPLVHSSAYSAAQHCSAPLLISAACGPLYP